MKRFLTALFASMAIVSPAMAEVQPGTYDLIQTVKAHMTVDIDTPFCDEQTGAAGAFDPKNERIILCPRGKVTADDHDTVRHEVWHVIQYCLTPNNSKVLAPVFEPGTTEWRTVILDGLSQRQIDKIKDVYPVAHHNVEIEAFSVARNLNAKQISKYFMQACIN
jgi:hypothetical protein